MTPLALIAFIVYELLIPLLFTAIFITFIWGLFRYYIPGGADEHARDEGKVLMVWAVCAFIALVIIWSVENSIGGLVTGTVQ